MDNAVEPVTDRPYIGVRPPPEFVVPVSYYYTQLYLHILDLVDVKLKETKKVSEDKVEEQRKLGEALALTKRLTDRLGGQSKTTVGEGAEPGRSEDLIALMEMNQALKDLRYIGDDRDESKPFLFGKIQITGAYASPPLTEERRLELETAMWRADDFRQLFVNGGPLSTNISYKLDRLATANETAYKSLNDQWIEIRNAGGNWKDKSTDAFWTQLKGTLEGEKQWLIDSGYSAKDDPLWPTIKEWLFKRFITEMKAKGSPLDYGASLSLSGLDMNYANGLLTTESNVLSQQTQKAVQEFQQQVSKEANYMNAITKVLESTLQLLRKLMP